MKSLLLAALAFLTVNTSLADTTDPYLWLEDMAGERALNWVRARNAESESLLEAEPGFAAMYESESTAHHIIK
jgi:prolyl oligopeptidase